MVAFHFSYCNSTLPASTSSRSSLLRARAGSRLRAGGVSLSLRGASGQVLRSVVPGASRDRLRSVSFRGRLRGRRPLCVPLRSGRCVRSFRSGQLRHGKNAGPAGRTPVRASFPRANQLALFSGCPARIPGSPVSARPLSIPSTPLPALRSTPVGASPCARPLHFTPLRLSRLIAPSTLSLRPAPFATPPLPACRPARPPPSTFGSDALRAAVHARGRGGRDGGRVGGDLGPAPA